MACNGRKFVKVTKFLLAGVAVFCVSWIACVNEWREAGGGRAAASMSTMRTIIGYSEGKQAELDRPSPVTCDSLPAYPTVPHINRTWTGGAKPKSNSNWQRVFGTSVSLYAAYYDHRLTQRYIRILATFRGRNFSQEPLYCQTRQLTPNEDSVEVVAAKPLVIWYEGWDKGKTEVERTPLLLSCPLTGPLKYPSIVSVVTEPCDDPTNAFLIEPNENTQYKRNFTVCVKDMNFENDISQNLLEWIETNKILGVDMIDLYIGNISRESENILLHYRNKGYVRLFHVPIKHKPLRPLWQRRRDHIITYNDCLYRNIGESAFVTPLDVDEVILPKIAFTWPQLVERLQFNGAWNPKDMSAIVIRNVFFFGFMQTDHEYKYKKLQSKNKTYVKRDDVRIRETNHLGIGEIGVVDTNSLSNEVVEDSNEDILENYKNRCGREMPEPKLVREVVRSALVSPKEFYGKSLMMTRKVLTAFNHYPLSSLGGSALTCWAPFEEVQLNHYKESCNPILVDCYKYRQSASIDRVALRLRTRLKAALANAVCTPIKAT